MRNAHPDADTPDPSLAYHSGGLYEVVLASLIFAVVWPLRRRFAQPGVALATVVGLYGIGRFLMFFVRSDSDEVFLGLNGAQWTSLGVVAAAAAGLAIVRRRVAVSGRGAPPPTHRSATP